MILVQNEIVKVEYEEAFDLLYYEWRGTGQQNKYRDAIIKTQTLLDGKKVRYWLIDAARSELFQFEDQVWLLDNLSLSFNQYHTLEKVAVIPSRDVYNLMATEHILNQIQGKKEFEFQYFSDVVSARDWLAESFREVYFFDDGLVLEYDAYHQWIYANWIGLHDAVSVKRGCELIMDLLKVRKCSKLLNDNRLASGTWAEAIPWILQDLLPRLEQTNLLSVAWVLSPSTLTRLNTLELVKALSTPIRVHVFHEFSAASHWLHTNPEAAPKQITFPGAATANP